MSERDSSGKFVPKSKSTQQRRRPVKRDVQPQIQKIDWQRNERQLVINVPKLPLPSVATLRGIWNDYWLWIIIAVAAAGYYVHKNYDIFPDRNDDDSGEVVPDDRLPADLIARVPIVFDNFYKKDRSSKAKILMDASGKDFSDDVEKLNWLNAAFSERLATDSEDVKNIIAEVVFNGKEQEASIALQK